MFKLCLWSKLVSDSDRLAHKILFYFHSTKPVPLTFIIFFYPTQILWVEMLSCLRSKQKETTSSSTNTCINSFWFVSHSWLTTEAGKMTLGLPSGFPAVRAFLPYQSVWNYVKHPPSHPEKPSTLTTSLLNIPVREPWALYSYTKSGEENKTTQKIKSIALEGVWLTNIWVSSRTGQ